MATILDPFIGKCVTLLADLVEKEVTKLLCVKDELQKLQHRMMSIQIVMKDVEKMKIRYQSTDYWLSQLTDIMYEVEDIIEDCQIMGTQLPDDQNANFKTSPVCCNCSPVFFSYFTSVPQRHEIAKRIEQLNVRLNQIYKDKEEFKLDKSEVSETSQITQVAYRETTSMVDPLVGGREVEVAANDLVNLLVTEKVEEKCRVFAVTGMGGIGKTTLAQKIYNHSKIQTYFNLKVWACVSQTYDDIKLLKQIIKRAKGSCEQDDTKEELYGKLKQAVASGGSLFLVLDDVWRANVWADFLRIPLCTVEASITVLVTTRYEDVANELGDGHNHPMTMLSELSSWCMLRRLVFSDREENLANLLEPIGSEIARKCKGLPLSIKVIAGVLKKKKRNQTIWKQVRDNMAWSTGMLLKELEGALYLSYEDLPSHLKQCFLYFSLYPENSNLYNYDFTKLWVVEGFINEQQISSMEEKAENYIKELQGRNLLLADRSNRFGVIRMHDVVRSLALYLSGGENSFGCENVNHPVKSPSRKTRRLSIINEVLNKELTQTFDSVADKKALRTLLAQSSNLLLNDEMLRQFSRLRILDISHTDIKILPVSIGDLVHLRYLNLSWTSITTIPESIKHLRYLQFLIIISCKELNELPNGITQLWNLRYLDLKDTSIRFFPKGIRMLQQLNHLNYFAVGCNDSYSKLEELSSLTQMRKLVICNLGAAGQYAPNFLENLTNLTDLELKFSDCDGIINHKLDIESVFNNVVLPPSLETLTIGESVTIENLFVSRSTIWDRILYLTSLTKLRFYNLNLSELPPLGQLPELKEVYIINISLVKKIGREFLYYGNVKGMVAFPKLEKLRIESLVLLKEWSIDAEDEQHASSRLLPCLQSLEIKTCPLLKQLPKGLKHSPTNSLLIDYSISLKTLDNLPTKIEKLKLVKNYNLEKVCCPPTLKQLKIKHCEALSCVETKVEALEKLEASFQKQSLPDWLLILLQQRVQQNVCNEDFQLKLRCDEKVLRECIEGGFYWNIIKQIPKVTTHGTGSLDHIKPDVYDLRFSPESDNACVIS